MKREEILQKIIEIVGRRDDWINSGRSMIQKRDIAEDYDKAIDNIMQLFAQQKQELIGEVRKKIEHLEEVDDTDGWKWLRLDQVNKAFDELEKKV